MLNLEQLRIFYFVPHKPQDVRQSSPYRGYTAGVLATAGLLSRALRWPFDIREAFSELEDVRALRMAGELQPRVFPIDITFLSEALEQGDAIFACVLTNNDEVASSVDDIAKSSTRPIFHLSTISGGERHDIHDLSLEPLRSYIGRVVARCRSVEPLKIVVDVFDSIKDGGRRAVLEPIELRKREHGVTAHNELALESLGYQLLPLERFDYSKDDNYIAAITASFDAIWALRAKVAGGRPAITTTMPHSAVLALPSVFTFHHKEPARERGASSKADQRVLRTVRRYITRGDEFGLRGGDELSEIMQHPLAQAMLQIHSQELHSFAAGLAMFSCSAFAPVMRLPPGIAAVRDELFNLGTIARSSSGSRRLKLNRLTVRSQARMAAAMRPELMTRIERVCAESGSIKLVADVPLEWLPVRGLPLMLRHNCSRLPATPGNLFIGRACHQEQVMLLPNALDELLVIRSFSVRDPIRGVLERVLIEFAKSVPGDFPNYRFVDVKTEAELISALNSYSGALVVFDCHGKWGSPNDVGTIVIGGKGVDVWALRGVARVPPVVVLSACDTHPADGSHASVGNGMLACGAIAVLATVLPIDARNAALFIARLFYRLKVFVGLVTRTGDRPLSWIQVIAGLQRMVHVTEVLRALEGSGEVHLSEDKSTALNIEANKWINLELDDWHERFLSELAAAVGKGEPTLRASIERHAALTDSMKYVQLGNPERIWIAPETVVKMHEEALTQLRKASI